jgi:hypothetical protein
VITAGIFAKQPATFASIVAIAFNFWVMHARALQETLLKLG